MDKRRIIRKPYSFRGRMIAALMIGSLLATVISLFLAFCVTHINLLQELKVRERAVAIYLMELEQRTELRTDELARLMEQNGIEVAVLSDEDVAALSVGTQRELKRAGIAYEATTWKSQRNPVTYVQMRTGVLAITAGGDGSSYGIAFARIIFGSTSFLAVFALMVTLASYWISKPVHEITNATRKVKEGDFTVKLDAAHAPGEIGELMRSFNAMTDALSRTSYLQKDFISSISHEFKTPIASMRLTLQNEDSALARKLTGDLFRVEQYAEMVLTYLRLDAGSTDYVFRTYDLDSIVKDAVKKFSSEFIGRKLRLVYAPLHTAVVTDEKWLSFVIEQVLSNALKYTRSGEISITLEAPQTLCIRDTGIGIASEDLPRIFEKGFTGYNGRSDKKASGIGLYLCRRICGRLNHTISVTSQVDVGTEVRIDLYHRMMEVE